MPFTPEPDPPPLLPPGWRLRLSLKWILALTTICCVLFAVWQGLLRGGGSEVVTGLEAKFWVIAVVTLPLLLMIVASLIAPTRKLIAKLRRR
jgi:hypothetical protein